LRRLAASEISELASSTEIRPVKPLVALTETQEFRRLLRFLAPYTGLLTLGVILMAVMAVGEALIAFSLRPALDIVLNPQSALQKLVLFQVPGYNPVTLNDFVPARVKHVWSVFALALLFIFIVKALAEYFGGTLIQYVGLSGITDLRNKAYSKVLQQPVGFFHTSPVGRVMSALINDVEQLRSAFSDYLADFFRQIFSMIAFVIVLLAINWRMAVGSVVLVPLVVLPVGKLARKIRRSTENSRARLADLSQILQETISGNRVVKAFGMESFEIRKFRQAARDLRRENMRWIRSLAATSPLMDILGAVVISLIIFFARGEIKAGRMSIGLFGAFTYSLFKAYEPVKRIGSIYQLFVQSLGIAAPVFTFLDLQEEQMDSPDAKALPRISRSVEFDGATFMYDDGDAPTLKNIDLKVPAGSIVAFVGSSGAGKTTLVNLLPRFYSPTTGAVSIDGYDLRGVSLRSLREQMAIVTQETILFNDTVWNNLCYGRPNMPEEKVFAAAKAALAHDFIMQMPKGYQTEIGDRGQRLSGGQRQRLAIARALLKDAPILILDEATSELDSESEMLVQHALANLMAGRTVFVIAHRLSTIRRADLIAVLEGGTIRERGTHDELLERRGLYARLYEMQFRDAEPAARTVEPV
jgi:ATP-binding cassette, subfamily B, bacterial MsbA